MSALASTYLRLDLVYGAADPRNEAACLATGLAADLFRLLYGNPEDPLVRGGLGIPTRLWELGNPQASVPFPVLPSTRAPHSATLLFIDDDFVVRPGAAAWVDELVVMAKAGPGVHRIFPVALTPNAFNLGDRLSRLNHIRYFEIPEPAAARRRLRRYVLHALCQLLAASLETGDSRAESNTERLFLSHAKSDGEAIARAFKKWIEGDDMLRTFFDARDLPSGASFSSELEEGVASTSLLAIQTDAYAASPWCRREVLWCKEHGRPVVVVNALTEGESRSFPYLGNAPVTRWRDESCIEPTVERLLTEAVRFRHFRGRIRQLQQGGWLPATDCLASASPPELLHLPPPDPGKRVLMVYPDPPLGIEELELLHRAAPGVLFVTPTFTTLPASGSGTPRPLEGRLVGLSISDNPDLPSRGFTQAHLQGALVEMSGQLLAQGASLAYGGYLEPPEGSGTRTRPNFTLCLMDLVHQHNRQSNPPVPRIRNYSAWPHYLRASPAWRAANFKEVEIIEVPPPGLARHLVDNGVVKVDGPVTPETLYTRARSLTAMRQRMNADVHARIFLGGKVSAYQGIMPGLLEEALLALERGIPTYVLGAFGGCAEAIGQALQGKSPECLTLPYQRSTTPSLGPLLDLLKSDSQASAECEAVDYPALLDRLHRHGFEGLHNGLSPDENLRLLLSEDLEEITRLVLSGLTRVRP